VALAGLVGFLGNEAVAIFRIRVGRQINSAALVADGHHARVDGLTSLAVVAGAAGVWLGFPLADPIVGLLITLTIFVIVWQSARTVFSRMLDGIDPEIVDEIRHAAAHLPDIRSVSAIRARWSGHRLTAEADLLVDPDMTVKASLGLAERFERELREHVPAVAEIAVRFRPAEPRVTP